MKDRTQLNECGYFAGSLKRYKSNIFQSGSTDNSTIPQKQRWRRWPSSSEVALARSQIVLAKSQWLQLQSFSVVRALTVQRHSE